MKNKGEMNIKRCMNLTLLYAVLAMVGGVFYREFTKFNGFTAKTTLGVIHTYYFLLGMVFFLRYKYGYFRNWSYPAGNQSGASADTEQAQRIRCEGLI